VNIIVDASLPVAAVADAGPDGRWATAVLSQSGLAAPHMMPAEVTNVLRRLEVAGRMSRLEAGLGAQDVLLVDIELLPFAPFAPRVWELRMNLTSYDAWYVAVAETFDVPLATLDRRLAASPGPRCRFLLPPG